MRQLEQLVVEGFFWVKYFPGASPSFPICRENVYNFMKILIIALPWRHSSCLGSKSLISRWLGNICCSSYSEIGRKVSSGGRVHTWLCDRRWKNINFEKINISQNILPAFHSTFRDNKLNKLSKGHVDPVPFSNLSGAQWFVCTCHLVIVRRDQSVKERGNIIRK